MSKKRNITPMPLRAAVIPPSSATYPLTVEEAKILIDHLEYSDSRIGDEPLGDDERALLERLRVFVAEEAAA